MSRNLAGGVFLICLATLALELLLTRIWSVLTWYHFAFMAVCLAMFGLTAGALLVFIYPTTFSKEAAGRWTAVAAIGFALTLVLSFMAQVCIPFIGSRTLPGISSAIVLFGVASLPFLCTGVCLAVIFTHYTEQIGKLYAADLIGAALGCLLLPLGLNIIDGPSMAFFIAAAGALSGYFFARPLPTRRLAIFALCLSIVLSLCATTNSMLAHNGRPLVSFLWSKGHREPAPLFEKWNAISRITVTGDPNQLSEPLTWGLSPAYTGKAKVRQLWLSLDSALQTPLTAYNGNCQSVDFLKYDVCNFAYYFHPQANALIIGVGGGRDVLSALCLGARSVKAVDINPDIISTVCGPFGDFTGHLDRDKRVKFIAEDARTYIGRTSEPFDMIQISLIDTGVLSANGALALTENSLYTVEAWQTFIEHLTPQGILACTRWYSTNSPGEVERLVATARASLLRLGIADPAAHIVVVRNSASHGPRNGWYSGLVMVSRQPFSAAQLKLIAQRANELQFVIMLSPGHAETKLFADIVNGTFQPGQTQINLQPVTDDNPFFFYMLRPLDSLFSSKALPSTAGIYVKAEAMLVQLLIVVLMLTAACLLLPIQPGKRRVAGAWSVDCYFIAIGFGFILIELSQMQRLIIFLGHPIYSLTLVLFVLLVSSGIGSFSTRGIAEDRLMLSARVRLFILLGVLTTYWLESNAGLESLRGASLVLRLAWAAASLFPAGLFMGMALPLGLSLARKRVPDRIPWLWGLNGAASICATVASVVIAIGKGLSAVFLLGVLCYVTALILLRFFPQPNGGSD